MDKQIADIKESALAIQKNLKSIGASREVALSVHVTKEVIARCEEKTQALIEQLESLSSRE